MALPAVALLAAVGGLLLLGDLAARIELALLLLAAAFAGQLWAVRRLEAAGRSAAAAGRPLAPRRLTALVLTVALALRLLLLPLAPTLSDDLLRYLWDGRVTAAGHNPYRLAPADDELAPLRDELWQRLPHKEVATVYPPLAMACFTAAAALPVPVRWQAVALKTIFTAADLIACWLLLALARRRGSPPERVAWYAWNPLVALEVAGMGHVDALGAAAVVAALLALSRRGRADAVTGARRSMAAGARRSMAAGAAWAAGVLAKLAPLPALPLWLKASRRPAVFLAVGLGLLAIALLPLLASTGGVPPGLVTYGVSWEFNGPVYEPLWRLLDTVGADRRLAHGLDRIKEWTSHHEGWNRFYPYLYPRFLAKLLLAAGMLAWIGRSVADRRPLIPATLALFGGLLLLSATFYPWYLLWVLPLAALERHRAWLALAPLAALSYLPQFRDVPLLPWLFLAIWLPFAALLLLERRRRANARP